MLKKVLAFSVILLILDLIAIIIIMIPHYLSESKDDQKQHQISNNKSYQEISHKDKGLQNNSLYLSNLQASVYITPTGECYHNFKYCAGKNAMPIKIDIVINKYRPCEKCVY